MTRDAEDKLANAIIALHREMKRGFADADKRLADAVVALRGEIRSLRTDMDRRFVKVNLRLIEHSVSIKRLAEGLDNLSADFNKYAKSNDALVKGHEIRLVKLEDKTSGTSFLAEPRAEYKGRKRKK